MLDGDAAAVIGLTTLECAEVQLDSARANNQQPAPVSFHTAVEKEKTAQLQHAAVGSFHVHHSASRRAA